MDLVRTRIVLNSELHRRARARAAGLGVSLDEYVRLIADDLSESASRRNVAVVFDLGDSGGGDVADHKHRYLEEAVDAEQQANQAR